MPRNLLLIVVFTCCFHAARTQNSYSSTPIQVYSLGDESDEAYQEISIEGEIIEQPITDPKGFVVSTKYSITDHDLPVEVSDTLRKRYYNKKYTGQQFFLMKNSEGDEYYSVQLSRPDRSLFVIMDKNGKVFKAELIY